jgi:hypothetical protein
MWQLVLQYLSVMGLCAIKFVPGALVGAGYGFAFFEQWLVTFLGGVLGTTVYTLAGSQVKRWFRRLMVKWRQHRAIPRIDRPPAKPKKTGGVGTWVADRFGLPGIALLTPPFFSPPIGVGLALALTNNVRKIILYMAVSMLVWSLLFAWLGPMVIDPIAAWLQGLFR